MKSNFVKVVFIIDASGSMYSSKCDVIGGFNSFIDEQKKINVGEETVSVYQFNTNLTKVFENKDINEVPELTNDNYKVGGSTALNDAVCNVIDCVGKELNDMDESNRPESVIVIIMTDGYENSSVGFTTKDVKDRITHQTEKYSWKFIYLGADITSTKDAEDIGIKNIGLSLKSNYSKVFNDMSGVVGQYRVCASSGDAMLNKTLTDMNDEYLKSK